MLGCGSASERMKALLGQQQGGVAVGEGALGGEHFALGQIGVDACQLTRAVAALHIRQEGLGRVHALLGLGTGLARSRHGPPGGAQLARQLQAQRMLLCHDLGLAAGSLGALRSFLARQPQRNGHFDLPFALALVGVKAVARGSQ